MAEIRQSGEVLDKIGRDAGFPETGRIFDVYWNELDGEETFVLVEACDEHFHFELTAGQLAKLGQELIDISKNPNRLEESSG